MLDAFPVAVTASLCDTLLILLAVYGVSLAVMGFHGENVAAAGRLSHTDTSGRRLRED
ncbi:hypothetical protein [Paenibacillus sp. NEAU-GSW1]|uniref:hypothetical protein n=1 Tax=Paenibacillus sp. NEAU-GSW1 TaxID=2682486 RepID=UPI0012E0F792|nr:hypothetical protein [Paenibacillus sp. NEAU-GSW1]